MIVRLPRLLLTYSLVLGLWLAAGGLAPAAVRLAGQLGGSVAGSPCTASTCGCGSAAACMCQGCCKPAPEPEPDTCCPVTAAANPATTCHIDPANDPTDPSPSDTDWPTLRTPQCGGGLPWLLAAAPSYVPGSARVGAILPRPSTVLLAAFTSPVPDTTGIGPEPPPPRPV